MEQGRYFNQRIDLRTSEVDDRVVDTTDLADAIKKAVLLSMDGRVSTGRRGALNALAIRLREQLRVLLVQVFDAGTAELKAANAEIAGANASLDEAASDLDQVVGTIEDLGKLAAALDKLLAIVGVFL